MMFIEEYDKIHSLYKRDDRGRFLPEFSRPEFAYLFDNPWRFTEKVDGTNIRIGFEHNGFRGNEHAHLAGRTNNAQLPPHLLNWLIGLARATPFEDVFPDPDAHVTLYGEGYGAKVQKGGGNYLPDRCDFVLFDVRVGSWWLDWPNVENVGERLGLRVVPVVGVGALSVAEKLVQDGFESNWGSFLAEGVVASPIVPLFGRDGSRVITKLKHKDYTKG